MTSASSDDDGPSNDPFAHLSNSADPKEDHSHAHLTTAGDLFSDISKSLTGGIRSFLKQSGGGGRGGSGSSVEEPMSLTSLITGSNCLKTCGIEDIQRASRAASDLFGTLRVCAVVLTSFLTLYLTLLIALRLYKMNLNKRRQQLEPNIADHFMSNNAKNPNVGREPPNGAVFVSLKNKLCSPSNNHNNNHNNNNGTPSIYSHPQLAQSDSSRSQQETATVCSSPPLPLPPSSGICAGGGHGNSANFFFETPGADQQPGQQQQQQPQHFNSLGEYLLAKRMVAPNQNGDGGGGPK